jgi:hypothetical protein
MKVLIKYLLFPIFKLLSSSLRVVFAPLQKDPKAVDPKSLRSQSYRSKKAQTKEI